MYDTDSEINLTGSIAIEPVTSTTYHPNASTGKVREGDLVGDAFREWIDFFHRCKGGGVRWRVELTMNVECVGCNARWYLWTHVMVSVLSS